MKKHTKALLLGKRLMIIVQSTTVSLDQAKQTDFKVVTVGAGVMNGVVKI